METEIAEICAGNRWNEVYMVRNSLISVHIVSATNNCIIYIVHFVGSYILIYFFVPILGNQTRSYDAVKNDNIGCEQTRKLISQSLPRC